MQLHFLALIQTALLLLLSEFEEEIKQSISSRMTLKRNPNLIREGEGGNPGFVFWGQLHFKKGYGVSIGLTSELPCRF